MKMNLAMTAAQVPVARKPEIGVESEVYFAPESCQLLGQVRATGATTGEYTSAGGLGLPAAGRELVVRILSPECIGNGGAMAVTFSVTLEDDTTDAAVATFDLPAWSGAGSLNRFPIGICSDLKPSGAGNSAKKIKAILSLTSMANQTVGNTFQLYSTPLATDFVFIECTTSKGGKYNLPSIVEIACAYNPAAYTKLGVGESNPLAIEFKTRGALEQLNRFNGSQGTIRMDIVKDGIVTAQRDLFSGYYVRTMSDRGSGNDEVLATSEGPYDQFLIGYPRVV
jgi:hypothetical protein